MRNSGFSGDDTRATSKPFNYGQFKQSTEQKQALIQRLQRLRIRKSATLKQKKAESIIDVLVDAAEESTSESSNKLLISKLVSIRNIILDEFKDDKKPMRNLLAQIEVVKRYVILHKDTSGKLDKFASSLKNMAQSASRGAFNLVSNSLNDPIINSVLPLLEKGYYKAQEYRDKRKQQQSDVRDTQERFAKQVLGKDKQRGDKPFGFGGVGGFDEFDDDDFSGFNDDFDEKFTSDKVKSRKKAKQQKSEEPIFKVKPVSRSSKTAKKDDTEQPKGEEEQGVNSIKIVNILDSHGILLKSIEINTKATVDHLKLMVANESRKSSIAEADDYLDLEASREGTEPKQKSVRYRDAKGRFISKAKWEELQASNSEQSKSQEGMIPDSISKYLPKSILEAVGGVALFKTALVDGVRLVKGLAGSIAGSEKALKLLGGVAQKATLPILAATSLWTNKKDAEELETDRLTAFVSRVIDTVSFGYVDKKTVAGYVNPSGGSGSEDKVFSYFAPLADRLVDFFTDSKDKNDDELSESVEKTNKTLAAQILRAEDNVKEINESIAKSQQSLTGDLAKDAKVQSLINFKLNRLAEQLEALLTLRGKSTPQDQVQYDQLVKDKEYEKANGGKKRQKAKVTGGIDFSKDDQLGGDFGIVARTMESGKGGAGTISSGIGDRGGKSYGLYQLASKLGNVDRFLDKSGYRDKFGDSQVGSSEFDDKWKELGKDKAFADAQHRYAMEEYYNPAMQALKDKDVDLAGRSRAVKEGILADANHYGPTGAVNKYSKVYKPGMTDEELIDAIAEQKKIDTEGDFSGNSATVRAGVYNRHDDQRKLSKSLINKNPSTDDKSNKLESSEKQLAQKENSLDKKRHMSLVNAPSNVNSSVSNNFILPNVRNSENSFNRVNECSFDTE